MSTPFTPVICQCPKCKRRFVEWWLTADIASKPPNIVKKVSCDICYGNNVSANQRSEILRLCLKRRQDMHKLYWKDCDKRHLDTWHRQYLDRGPNAYAAHTPPDKDGPLGLASQSKPDYTLG